MHRRLPHRREKGRWRMADEASEAAGAAARRQMPPCVAPSSSGSSRSSPSRVLKEAARYARLFGAPLLIVHVDVTRFVTYEDPDGYVHSAPIDMNVAGGEADLAAVTSAATTVLDGIGAQLERPPARRRSRPGDQAPRRRRRRAAHRRRHPQARDRRVDPRVLHRLGGGAPRAPSASPDPGRPARRAHRGRRGDLAGLIRPARSPRVTGVRVCGSAQGASDGACVRCRAQSRDRR